jgi:hypothetical protein
MADMMIDTYLLSYNLSSDLLAQISLNLSAHFAAMRYRLRGNDRAGPVAETFQGQTGKGLESSFYGQTAMQLDPTGVLRRRCSGLIPPSIAILGSVGYSNSPSGIYVD